MKKKKLLMIEDDKVDRKAFERFMNSNQTEFEYKIAKSFAQAKEILSCNKFDIIISDYLLGDGTAFDVLNLKLNVPIVFLTGSGDESTAVEAMHSGAADYLVKDFKRHYLEYLIIRSNKAIAHFKEEKELKEHRQRWKMLLENLPNRLISIDKDYKIDYINKHSAPTRELVGKNVFDFVKPEWQNSFKVNLTEVFKTGKVKVVEFEENEGSWLEVRFIPIQRKASVESIMMIITDISRDKVIEAMKDKFIDHVSHELRTPITSIKGFAQAIIFDSDMEIETRNEFLSIIHKESERLSRLVNDILDLSKIQNGNMQMSFDYEPISGIVREAADSLHLTAKEKAIEIKIDFPEIIPNVLCDKRRIIQVIINLLSNAIKFSKPESKVEMKIENLSDTARIYVIDKGNGIPEDQQELIFEKFHQVNYFTSRQVGTGLGLSIASEIIKAHNSQIKLISEVDKGSTFWFDLKKKKIVNSSTSCKEKI